MANAPRILWADDEIDLLRPHILFLQNKGYDVTSVSNGADAVDRVREERFDLVLLDEQMPGIGGLEALSEIKLLSPDVPVVMVTKSEEERIMEEALEATFHYLTKPVNPSQILLTVKRILDTTRLRNEKASQDYLQSFSQITMQLMDPLSHGEWVELYQRLVRYDLELEGDEAARQILADQYAEANRAFGKYVEDEYAGWIRTTDAKPDEERPVLSHEVVPTFVLPHLKPGRNVFFFFLIDCMRYDQWLEFERLLYPLFNIEKDFHYSILPTATPYSRNAIFSGLLPRDIQKQYPRFWSDSEEDEYSRNRNEEEFLRDLLKRNRKEVRVRYEKLVGTNDGRDFAHNLADYRQYDLSAIVINFVDILAHSRSDSVVLKEIAPDERAYRALTRTWFEHSWLYQAFQDLARHDCTIVITSDHGVIRSLKPTKVIGDRETSTALRYKYGRNLRAEDKGAIYVKDPHKYGLPSTGMNSNYLIAKEDYYFVYPTNYHHYLNMYKDTMQHGGASLQEMILPVITMRPKG